MVPDTVASAAGLSTVAVGSAAVTGAEIVASAKRTVAEAQTASTERGVMAGSMPLEPAQYRWSRRPIRQVPLSRP
jgi:hypothetical protein